MDLFNLPSPSSRTVVDSASKRNELEESFWKVKGGRRVGLSVSPMSRKCGSFNVSQSYGPPRPFTGIAFTLLEILDANILNASMQPLDLEIFRGRSK
jgi:hypothetical protein